MDSSTHACAEAGPWRRIAAEPAAVFGLFVLTLLLALSVAAPLIAPHDPLEQDLMLNTLPPIGSAEAEAGYWLGTDGLGRDVLSRLIYGSRVTLIVALAAAFLAAILGSTLGLLAGYLGGWVDRLVSWLVDVWTAFPPVLLAILLVAVLGTGLTTVIIAIAVIDWTRFCRVIRAETARQASLEYVAVARLEGAPMSRILWRELLPNVLPTIGVLFTLEMGIAVTVETILSFVGLSLSSDFPTWGGMIAEGRQIVHQAWWVLAWPLLCLLVVVLAFNQLGDGLRRALDPVMQR